MKTLARVCRLPLARLTEQRLISIVIHRLYEGAIPLHVGGASVADPAMRGRYFGTAVNEFVIGVLRCFHGLVFFKCFASDLLA